MKQLFTLILFLFGVGAATGQVITSLTDKNLKVPPMPKYDKNKEPGLRGTIAVKLDTTSVYYAYVDSAAAMIAAERWADAEQFLRLAIAGEPENPQNSLLLSNLATLQRMQGNNAEAVKNYSLALDMTPNAVTLLHNRAAAYLELGEVDKAQADYEHIIRLDPRDIDSRYNHGLIAMDQGDIAQAKTDFEQIEVIDSKSPLGPEGLATLYKALGELNKAIEHYSVAIRLKEDATLRANRADCYLALSLLNAAENDIIAALKLAPDDGFIYLLRAKLNKMRFQRSEMERDIQLAVKHGVEPAVAKALLQVD